MAHRQECLCAFFTLFLGYGGKIWQLLGESVREFRIWIRHWIISGWGIMWSGEFQDNRRIVYFRFASHEPLVKECPQVERIEIPLSHRFEDFTVKIHKIIEKEGFDVFYVFDCLSELQTAWATDLMMGNFFRVTCPFLFTLDTVAFFPIIRGKHSFHAVKKILNTTQLLLDVYSDRRNTYVRPAKVCHKRIQCFFCLINVFNK